MRSLTQHALGRRFWGPGPAYRSRHRFGERFLPEVPWGGEGGGFGHWAYSGVSAVNGSERAHRVP